MVSRPMNDRKNKKGMEKQKTVILFSRQLSIQPYGECRSPGFIPDPDWLDELKSLKLALVQSYGIGGPAGVNQWMRV